MMKLKYLAGLVVTVSSKREPLMASEFKQVQVQLEHPANGDSLFIPGAKALLQSGHSSDSRWLSWGRFNHKQRQAGSYPHTGAVFP